MPYFENKAHKLELACGLWMDILSTDWSSSEVGAQLSASLLSDRAGGEAVNILRACFGVKSPSTLIKRINAFRQLIQRHFNSGFGTLNTSQPLPLEEKVVWEYFQYLRGVRLENKQGYTVPSSFLEAVRFGRFTLALKHTGLFWIHDGCLVVQRWKRETRVHLVRRQVSRSNVSSVCAQF